MKKDMQATSLRSLLIGLVLLTLAAASVAFYFGFDWIKSHAEEVNTVIVAASQSGSTANSVNELREQLEKQQEIITTANSLFALTSNYQTQVIKDVYAYAEKTGINVSDIQLAEEASSGSSSGSKPTSSLSTKSVTISLEGSVSYQNLLKFLTYIETNIPKMQISGIELSRPSDGSASVSISNITIGMYVR